MNALSIRNRQRTRPVNLRLLRKITIYLLREILAQSKFELGIHLVGAAEMTRVNETFLQHTGSTDVITFNHNESANPITLHGELFISLDDAVQQASEFRTTWQSELTRYIIHGILHLQGYDDLDPVSRRKMKRVEGQSLKQLTTHFPLQQLQRT